MLAVLVTFLTSTILTDPGAIGNETPTAEQAPDKAAAETTAAAAESKEDKEFTPPPGFLTKKRGEMVLYCKRDRETGARFTTKKCYD